MKASAPLWIPIALLVASIIGVPLGIYLFYRGFSVLARKRFIQNIPGSTVRGAAIGEVELSGRATGPYTLLSPLSQTECYYYKVEIVLAGTTDRASARGRSVESLSVPFFLEDGTGSVLIDARGAEIDLPCTFDELVSTLSEGDCVRHFIERRSLPESGIRLLEYCVREGDSLFVLGTLAENSAAQNAESPAANEPGFLSREAADLQRQEILEYLHVPVPANSRMEERAASRSGKFDMLPPVVLRKGTGPFIISRHSQREVIQQLAGQSLLYIWGGPILALASLAYLLVRLTQS